MDKPAPTIKGRKVAILLADGVDTAQVQGMLESLVGHELVVETIGPRAGAVAASEGPLMVNRAAPNAPSVIYDAVAVPAGVAKALAAMPVARRFINEAFRHGKPIAVAVYGESLLHASGVPADAEGIVIGQAGALVDELTAALGLHRFPRRVSLLTPV